MEDETFYWDGLIGEILNEFLVTSLLALFLISTSLLTKGNLVPRLSLLPFLGAAERREIERISFLSPTPRKGRRETLGTRLNERSNRPLSFK